MDVREAQALDEERRTKNKYAVIFKGLKPLWIIIGVALLLVFLSWYAKENNTTLPTWIPAVAIIGGLIVIAMGQSQQETSWVTREEAEALVRVRAKQEQRSMYSEIPQGDILITHLGGPDYEKITHFILWFVMDKVANEKIWFVGKVDCYGKGYLGSHRVPPGEVPTGKEGGYYFKPITGIKEAEE